MEILGINTNSLKTEEQKYDFLMDLSRTDMNVLSSTELNHIKDLILSLEKEDRCSVILSIRDDIPSDNEFGISNTVIGTFLSKNFDDMLSILSDRVKNYY